MQKKKIAFFQNILHILAEIMLNLVSVMIKYSCINTSKSGKQTCSTLRHDLTVHLISNNDYRQKPVNLDNLKLEKKKQINLHILSAAFH